ncbi:MAG: hypothetical protein Q9212_007438 [Teloschistes hypoglaucus]
MGGGDSYPSFLASSNAWPANPNSKAQDHTVQSYQSAQGNAPPAFLASSIPLHSRPKNQTAQQFTAARRDSSPRYSPFSRASRPEISKDAIQQFGHIRGNTVPQNHTIQQYELAHGIVLPAASSSQPRPRANARDHTLQSSVPEARKASRRTRAPKDSDDDDDGHEKVLWKPKAEVSKAAKSGFGMADDDEGFGEPVVLWKADTHVRKSSRQLARKTGSRARRN